MVNEWQNLGWCHHLSCGLGEVDPQLHEAAKVDGQRGCSDLAHQYPSIFPTIVIMLVLRMGSMMSVGFEKILLMQNPLNLSSSQVISTYVYDSGLLHGQYDYATAIGLFNSLINLIMLVIANRIARRTGMSLW